jgi:hypothetical protein
MKRIVNQKKVFHNLLGFVQLTENRVLRGFVVKLLSVLPIVRENLLDRLVEESDTPVDSSRMTGLQGTGDQPNIRSVFDK